MDSSGYEWDPRPPNLRERICAGVYVGALIVASCSTYADWKLFGNYDKQIAIGLVILGLVLMRFMPGVRRT